MTEGIIQKIINKYTFRKQFSDEPDLSFDEVNYYIKRLEQELTEEIRKEFDLLNAHYDIEKYTEIVDTIRMCKSKLIGDSKE